MLALLRGPIAAENSLELRTAIPPETEVLGVETTDGTALVDLSNAFTLVGGDQEILAVAQIVATLSSLEGIGGVRFAIEGSPRPAPVAEGELVDRPLVPADFEPLFVR
jgi:spore germination protein GerM